MPAKRSKFPRSFWVANSIEVLERFAYYGLYLGFSIYATTAVARHGLGWSKTELGLVQTVFLFLSYFVPLISGIMADRYGFKRMLLTSYVLYLPGFLLLMLVREYALVVGVMALIAVAAGVFKPLIAGTVRLTTDHTNRTLGFGLFYLMVNVGAFFGPLTAGALRTRSWNHAFLAAAVAVAAMALLTLLLYRNPLPVESDPAKRPPLTQTLQEIVPFLKDPRIFVFIIIFGLLIEIPFWSFFNLLSLFIDSHVRTDLLYQSFLTFFTTIGLGEAGRTILGWFSTVGPDGTHRIAGETLGQSALYIIILQMAVTRTTERLRSIPTVALGIFIMVIGCVGLFASVGPYPGIVFLGIVLFSVGEMACMPRFEQYLISMLPPEKTGLGGGLLRIPVAVGAFSGVIMTSVYGALERRQAPEAIWLVIGGTLLVGFVAMVIYDRFFRSEK